ncbi:MAG TPA: hypothetical protein VFZ09_27660 [Archangium sp.]|uniref:DUF6884 domain-containing protein n=1 Tax=Archangium sp. TaxID=1872627 RepID=UPI002E31A959|nr:DUF6884 domain-containing protein [Archangium sp.]HEX5750038.1 hypothetical protein [Archangium sp.]
MTSDPRRYALVGCGKEKLDRAAPARDLYTGPLFRAALEVAEAEFGADVWILSAKYGLTDLDEVLEPYDLHLDDLTGDELLDWGRDVIRNLTDDDLGTPAHLTVYAGAAYVNALRAHLPASWVVAAPMEGLGQGHRLAWLKARRAALTATPAAANSAAPSPSAGPCASPLELRMSNAIPTMLTHAQRGEAFTAALALEDGLKELEDLKARLLAELEAMADAMRQKHARLMRAATTGVSPEAPEQQSLPLADASPVSPVQTTATASADEDEPPPSSPSGKSRSRSRKGAPEEKGTKRAAANSARTASSAQANASPGAEVDDSVPAPRVPCCECGDSVADHKDGTGRCLRVRGMSKCKCKRFTPAAVELGGWPGWKVRPHKGSLSTGRGGEQGCTIVATWQGGESETPPVWWVPGYGLAFQDGEAVNCVYSYLGESATTLTYEKDTRWNWVPRPVLRAVAEYLGATWPEKQEASAEPSPAAEPTEELPRMETTPDHPCECDGCGSTFKASEFQPVGEGESRGFYCAPCKAEVDDFDSAKPDAKDSLDDKLRRAESQRKAPLPAPDWTKALDKTALLDFLEGPRRSSMEYLDELEVTGTNSSCDGCGEGAISDPPTRARLSFTRRHRPQGGTTWEAEKDPKAGAVMFSRWKCQRCTEALLPTTKASKTRRSKGTPKEAPAPALPASEPVTAPAAPVTWRVELPERNEGHTIIRLWLVNDATGERKPATWWSGVSSLRRSHHLSGKLEGEQLAAHMELESWWADNADSVVKPLAEDCREGRVPGLKVYEPETLGAGPHIYALSNCRTLEAWEGEGEKAEPHVDFVSPTARGDVQLRVGPFVLSPDGHLTTADTEALDWSAENEGVVAEAEDFIRRGFIFELRQEVVA